MAEQQNTPQQQLQPTQQRKYRRVKNIPVLEAAAIAKFSAGECKSDIAKDLGVHRNTIAGILNASEIQQHIEYGRSRAVSLIPKSLDVAEYRLNKNDGSMALGILRGTQVLVNQQIAQSTTNNFAVMIAQLKQDRSAEPGASELLTPAAAIEVQPSTTTNSGQALTKPASKRK